MAAAPRELPRTLYFAYGSNLSTTQMHSRCPRSRLVGVARLRNYAWTINARGYANVVDTARLRGPGSPQPEPNTVQQCPATTDVSDDVAASGSVPADDAEVVYGLVYALDEADEERLDLAEGVPSHYGKEYLPVSLWPVHPEAPLAERTTAMPDLQHIADPFAPDVVQKQQKKKKKDGASKEATAPQELLQAPKPQTGRAYVEEGKARAVLALVYVDRERITAGSIKMEYISRMRRGVAEAEERGLPVQWMDKIIVPWLKETNS